MSSIEAAQKPGVVVAGKSSRLGKKGIKGKRLKDISLFLQHSVIVPVAIPPVVSCENRRNRRKGVPRHHTLDEENDETLFDGKIGTEVFEQKVNSEPDLEIPSEEGKPAECGDPPTVELIVAPDAENKQNEEIQESEAACGEMLDSEETAQANLETTVVSESVETDVEDPQAVSNVEDPAEPDPADASESLPACISESVEEPDTVDEAAASVEPTLSVVSLKKPRKKQRSRAHFGRRRRPAKKKPEQKILEEETLLEAEAEIPSTDVLHADEGAGNQSDEEKREEDSPEVEEKMTEEPEVSLGQPEDLEAEAPEKEDPPEPLENNEEETTATEDCDEAAEEDVEDAEVEMTDKEEPAEADIEELGADVSSIAVSTQRKRARPRKRDPYRTRKRRRTPRRVVEPADIPPVLEEGPAEIEEKDDLETPAAEETADDQKLGADETAIDAKTEDTSVEDVPDLEQEERKDDLVVEDEPENPEAAADREEPGEETSPAAEEEPSVHDTSAGDDQPSFFDTGSEEETEKTDEKVPDDEAAGEATEEHEDELAVAEGEEELEEGSTASKRGRGRPPKKKRGRPPKTQKRTTRRRTPSIFSPGNSPRAAGSAAGDVEGEVDEATVVVESGISFGAEMETEQPVATPRPRGRPRKRKQSPQPTTEDVVPAATNNHRRLSPRIAERGEGSRALDLDDEEPRSPDEALVNEEEHHFENEIGNTETEGPICQSSPKEDLWPDVEIPVAAGKGKAGRKRGRPSSRRNSLSPEPVATPAEDNSKRTARAGRSLRSNTRKSYLEEDEDVLALIAAEEEEEKEKSPEKEDVDLEKAETERILTKAAHKAEPAKRPVVKSSFQAAVLSKQSFLSESDDEDEEISIRKHVEKMEEHVVEKEEVVVEKEPKKPVSSSLRAAVLSKRSFLSEDDDDSDEDLPDRKPAEEKHLRRSPRRSPARAVEPRKSKLLLALAEKSKSCFSDEDDDDNEGNLQVVEEPVVEEDLAVAEPAVEKEEPIREEPSLPAEKEVEDCFKRPETVSQEVEKEKPVEPTEPKLPTPIVENQEPYQYAPSEPVDELSNALRFLTDSTSDFWGDSCELSESSASVTGSTSANGALGEYNEEETQLAIESLMGIMEEPIVQPTVDLVELAGAEQLYAEDDLADFDFGGFSGTDDLMAAAASASVTEGGPMDEVASALAGLGKEEVKDKEFVQDPFFEPDGKVEAESETEDAAAAVRHLVAAESKIAEKEEEPCPEQLQIAEDDTSSAMPPLAKREDLLSSVTVDKSTPMLTFTITPPATTQPEPPKKSKKKKKTKKERQEKEDDDKIEELHIPFEKEVIQPVEQIGNTFILELPAPTDEPIAVEKVEESQMDASFSTEDEENNTSGEWQLEEHELEGESEVGAEEGNDLSAEDLFFRTVDDGADFECLPALQPIAVAQVAPIEPVVAPVVASVEDFELVTHVEPPAGPTSTATEVFEFEHPAVQAEESEEVALAPLEPIEVELEAEASPASMAEFQTLQPLQAIGEELLPPPPPSEDELLFVKPEVNPEAVTVTTATETEGEADGSVSSSPPPLGLISELKPELAAGRQTVAEDGFPSMVLKMVDDGAGGHQLIIEPPQFMTDDGQLVQHYDLSSLMGAGLGEVGNSKFPSERKNPASARFSAFLHCTEEELPPSPHGEEEIDLAYETDVYLFRTPSPIYDYSDVEEDDSPAVSRHSMMPRMVADGEEAAMEAFEDNYEAELKPLCDAGIGLEAETAEGEDLLMKALAAAEEDLSELIQEAGSAVKSEILHLAEATGAMAVPEQQVMVADDVMMSMDGWKVATGGADGDAPVILAVQPFVQDGNQMVFENQMVIQTQPTDQIGAEAWHTFGAPTVFQLPLMENQQQSIAPKFEGVPGEVLVLPSTEIQRQVVAVSHEMSGPKKQSSFEDAFQAFIGKPTSNVAAANGVSVVQVIDVKPPIVVDSLDSNPPPPLIARAAVFPDSTPTTEVHQASRICQPVEGSYGPQDPPITAGEYEDPAPVGNVIVEEKTQVAEPAEEEVKFEGQQVVAAEVEEPITETADEQTEVVKAEPEVAANEQQEEDEGATALAGTFEQHSGEDLPANDGTNPEPLLLNELDDDPSVKDEDNLEKEADNQLDSRVEPDLAEMVQEDSVNEPQQAESVKDEECQGADSELAASVNPNFVESSEQTAEESGPSSTGITETVNVSFGDLPLEVEEENIEEPSHPLDMEVGTTEAGDESAEGNAAADETEKIQEAAEDSGKVMEPAEMDPLRETDTVVHEHSEEPIQPLPELSKADDVVPTVQLTNVAHQSGAIECPEGSSIDNDQQDGIPVPETPAADDQDIPAEESVLETAGEEPLAPIEMAEVEEKQEEQALLSLNTDEVIAEHPDDIQPEEKLAEDDLPTSSDNSSRQKEDPLASSKDPPVDTTEDHQQLETHEEKSVPLIEPAEVEEKPCSTQEAVEDAQDAAQLEVKQADDDFAAPTETSKTQEDLFPLNELLAEVPEEHQPHDYVKESSDEDAGEKLVAADAELGKVDLPEPSKERTLELQPEDILVCDQKDEEVEEKPQQPLLASEKVDDHQSTHQHSDGPSNVKKRKLAEDSSPAEAAMEQQQDEDLEEDSDQGTSSKISEEAPNQKQQGESVPEPTVEDQDGPSEAKRRKLSEDPTEEPPLQMEPTTSIFGCVSYRSQVWSPASKYEPIFGSTPPSVQPKLGTDSPRPVSLFWGFGAASPPAEEAHLDEKEDLERPRPRNGDSDCFPVFGAGCNGVLEKASPLNGFALELEIDRGEKSSKESSQTGEKLDSDHIPSCVGSLSSENPSRTMRLRQTSGLKMHEALELLRPYASRRHQTSSTSGSAGRRRSASIAGETSPVSSNPKMEPVKYKRQRLSPSPEEDPSSTTTTNGRKGKGKARRKSGNDVPNKRQQGMEQCYVRIKKLKLPDDLLLAAIEENNQRASTSSGEGAQVINPPPPPQVVPVGPGSRENCGSVESGYDSDEASGTNLARSQALSPPHEANRQEEEEEEVADGSQSTNPGGEEDVGLLKRRCDEAVRILGRVLSNFSNGQTSSSDSTAAEKGNIDSASGLTGQIPSWLLAKLTSNDDGPSTSAGSTAAAAAAAAAAAQSTPEQSEDEKAMRLKKRRMFFTEQDVQDAAEVEAVLEKRRKLEEAEKLDEESRKIKNAEEGSPSTSTCAVMRAFTSPDSSDDEQDSAMFCFQRGKHM